MESRSFPFSCDIARRYAELLIFDFARYEELGNIISKSDIGYTLNYGGKNSNGSTTGRPDATNSAIGPHALSTIAGVPANFPSAELNVTYTDFKKIKTLTEDNKYYELTYGVDDQRRVSVYKENDVTKETRYYLGGYEERTDDLTGITEKIHYLSGAIYIERSNGTNNLYYTYSDAQGSLIALSDDAGTLVQRYAYDSWGARRNPDNWTLAATPPSGGWGAINRGYTGHEHLDAFGIINMNGRVYDPLTAMFFSPDPTLTDAGNWLDYNRYSYCLNNPFRYTDPSGYTWWAENWQPVLTTAASLVVGIGVGILAAPLGVVVTGMLAGAAGGFTSGALGTALQGGSFNDVMGAGIKGMFIGGATGALGGALSIFGGAGMTFAENLLLGTAEGAVTGGFSALLSGTDIGTGMLLGAAAGTILTTVFSENTSNLFKGKGFYTNENVFNHMIADGVSKQDILKYFNFKGVYNPGDSGPSYVDKNSGYVGYTDSNGTINYGDMAFKSYTSLKSTYIKELYHSMKVLKGIPFETQNSPEVKDSKFFPEERLGFIHQYENQGLYPKIKTNIIKNKITYYQIQSYNLTPNQYYKFNWYDFIYKIPRRW